MSRQVIGCEQVFHVGEDLRFICQDKTLCKVCKGRKYALKDFKKFINKLNTWNNRGKLGYGKEYKNGFTSAISTIDTEINIILGVEKKE